MSPDGEDFPPILEQSAEHIRSEEGSGRAHGLAEGVANPGRLADGLDKDGEGNAADEVALGGFQFSSGAAVFAGASTDEQILMHDAGPFLPFL